REGFETKEIFLILQRTQSDAPWQTSTLVVYDESISRIETHPLRLREGRVRIGRETKIEVKIQSDRKNHTGRNRCCRSRGRRGLRNLHAVLPICADGSSRCKPSGELWCINHDCIDRHASYRNSSVTRRAGLELFIRNRRNNSDKR